LLCLKAVQRDLLSGDFCDKSTTSKVFNLTGFVGFTAQESMQIFSVIGIQNDSAVVLVLTKVSAKFFFYGAR
jgi:hypothetical protein